MDDKNTTVFDVVVDFKEPLTFDEEAMGRLGSVCNEKIEQIHAMIHDAFEQLRSKNPNCSVITRVSFTQSPLGENPMVPPEMNGNPLIFTICKSDLSEHNEQHVSADAGNAILFFYIGITESIRRINAMGRAAAAKLIGKAVGIDVVDNPKAKA